MNFEGERFLFKLYRDLDQSDSLKKADIKSGSRSGTKFEMLQKYLNRLEKQQKVFDNNHEMLERFLKNKYYEKYVIKEDNFPESYFKNKSKLSSKKEEISKVINDQKKSLDRWLDYLLKENAHYPMWVRYWAFQGMLRLGTYDKEKNMYLKRTKTTTAPFADLNAEALAKTIETALQYINKKEIKDQKINDLVKSGNFGKLYAYNIWKINIDTKKYDKNELKNNIGKWIEYTKGDEKRLIASLEGKITGWCITGEAVARDYLKEGNMHIYYTKDKSGNYSIPRICLRFDHDKIAEIRGVDATQNMEPDMLDVIDKKLNDYDDNFLYKKKITDMKKLTEVYNKSINHKKLSHADFEFLYEVNGKIEGFGWEEDPRLEKLRKENIITDREFLLKVIKENSYFFMYASEKLKNDKDVILEAIKYNALAFTYANKKYRDDKDIILSAVKRNGMALMFASERLKNDKEFIRSLNFINNKPKTR